MTRVPLLLIAVLTLSAPAASAQPGTSDRLPAGTRVRVRTVPGGRLVGTILSHRGDTLLVQRATWLDSVRVPPHESRRIDVSTGRYARKGRGAALGLLGGATTGGIVGAVLYSDEPGECRNPNGEQGLFSNFCPSLDFGRGFNVAVGSILGGAAGLVTGILVGARRVDRWRPVGEPRQTSDVRVHPTTGRAGPGLAVALPF